MIIDDDNHSPPAHVQGGVLQCGRLAMDTGRAKPGDPVHVALFRGNQCHYVSEDQYADATGGVRQFGAATPGSCATSFDDRGANLGSLKHFALYKVQPRGTMARYMCLMHPKSKNNNYDLHIVGMDAYFQTLLMHNKPPYNDDT